jgi:hypothetical protein
VAAVALKSTPMLAQASNAMAAPGQQENSRDLTEGVEEACMAAPN